jgi:hypothetical protein
MREIIRNHLALVDRPRVPGAVIGDRPPREFRRWTTTTAPLAHWRRTCRVQGTDYKLRAAMAIAASMPCGRSTTTFASSQWMRWARRRMSSRHQKLLARRSDIGSILDF